MKMGMGTEGGEEGKEGEDGEGKKAGEEKEGHKRQTARYLDTFRTPKHNQDFETQL